MRTPEPESASEGMFRSLSLRAPRTSKGVEASCYLFNRFEDCIMTRKIALAACVVLMAMLAASFGIRFNPRGVRAAEPAPAVGDIPLEVGKAYTFSWPQGPFVAEVVEKPRGHWVKVKRPEDKVGPYWFNLDTILYVRQEAEIKKK